MINKNLKVLFLGNKQAGLIALLTLGAFGCEICGVITQDERIMKVAHLLQLSSFSSFRDNGVECIVKDCHLIVSVHNKEILPKDFLILAKYGGINVHPCLNKYKGKDTIKRMLKDKTGIASVGVHWMTERVDEGDIIIEEYVEVSKCHTVNDVYNELYPYYSVALIGAINNVINAIKGKE